MSVQIQLTPAEVAWCVETGTTTYQLFEGKAGYYRNLLDSHIVGKIGEIATERWLLTTFANRPLLSHFRNPNSLGLCDIEIENGMRLEVKTWKANFWAEWGRCVSPKQMAKHLRQVDAFVWCRLEKHVQNPSTHIGPLSLIIEGFSTVDDVTNTKTRYTGPLGKQVLNHQLEMGEIRPIEQLHFGQSRHSCGS